MKSENLQSSFGQQESYRSTHQSATYALQQFPLFAGIAESDLEGLAAKVTSKSWPKGATVLKEGEAGRALYLLVRGRARVYVSQPYGREYVLSTIGPGEHIGEVALLDGRPGAVSVEVVQAATFLLINKDDYMSFLLEHPAMQTRLLVSLTQRARMLTEAAKGLALRDVYTRLRMLLDSMTVERNGMTLVDEPFTQQALANRVGSSREMVARIIRSWVQGGYMRLENRRHIILQTLPELA